MLYVTTCVGRSVRTFRLLGSAPDLLSPFGGPLEGGGHGSLPGVGDELHRLRQRDELRNDEILVDAVYIEARSSVVRIQGSSSRLDIFREENRNWS
jgi:hypothetical protein